MEHSILNESAFIQQKSAEWPTSQGGPLPDLQQYGTYETAVLLCADISYHANCYLDPALYQYLLTPWLV
jgi:hypothetical protein